MDRRIMRMHPMDQVPDDLLPGAGGPTGEVEEGSSPKPAQNLDSPPTGSESPFADGPLKGLTAAEAAERMRVMEATINAQREQAERTRNQPVVETRTPVVEAAPKDPSAAEFWTDPVGNIRTLVKEQLTQQITPFREDLARSRARESWDEVRAKFPDFGTYETLVKQMVQNNRVDNPTAALLETFYYTAVGYTDRNSKVNNSDPNPQTDRPPIRNVPPQHRASSQPVPSSEPRADAYELTEEDRVMMRRWGITTKEEFLAYKNSSEENVLTAFTPPVQK